MAEQNLFVFYVDHNFGRIQDAEDEILLILYVVDQAQVSIFPKRDTFLAGVGSIGNLKTEGVKFRIDFHRFRCAEIGKEGGGETAGIWKQE